MHATPDGQSIHTKSDEPLRNVEQGAFAVGEPRVNETQDIVATLKNVVRH